MSSVYKPPPRINRESITISAMIRIYCRDHHDHGDGLCKECRRLLEYAEKRLEKCPYQEEKPTCANCPIHCYKPVMKEKVIEVMRYAGPRMLFKHPYLAACHLLDGRKKVTKITKTRNKRTDQGEKQ